MRLIDADACPAAFDKEYKETKRLICQGETHLDNLAEGFAGAHSAIYKMPTIEAEPVRHARWVEQCTKGFHRAFCTVFVCSECEKRYNTPNMAYCPHCGAKMDGGAANE